jgi:hypothetical protein
MRTFDTLPMKERTLGAKEKPASMKKNSKSDKQTAKQQGEQNLWAYVARWNTTQDLGQRLTFGIDLGDRASCWCALDGQGEVVARGQVVTEKQPLENLFSKIPAS